MRVVQSLKSSVTRKLGRRGGVAVMFAGAMLPMLIGTVVAIDVTRLMASKAALQRIADNAALTGAAVYVAYTASDSFKTIAETMATSSFCNAAKSLPAGYTLTTPTSGTMKNCGDGSGPTAVGQITGYQLGTRGLTNGSGCTATNTVVAPPVKCGFAITVTAQAKATSFSASLVGSTTTSVTATAMNPFIDLSTALSVKSLADAANANSIWVYPVLLDDDGRPDFSSNQGALPDRSACTSDPEQFNCGVYTMLASNHFAKMGCTDVNPCVRGTSKVGSNGKVLNAIASKAVITATTPLGFAFASAANAEFTWYDTRLTSAATPAGNKIDPTNGCAYPFRAVYQTITQMRDGANFPTVDWTLATHWFFSSYLKNGQSPMQPELAMQSLTGFRNDNDELIKHPANTQKIAPSEDAGGDDHISVAQLRKNEGVTLTCPPKRIVNGLKIYPDSYYIYMVTKYPTNQSNCALYIKQFKNTKPADVDPRPNPYTQNSSGTEYTGGPYPGCFTPSATPGAKFSIIQCQDFKGDSFAYYWNDAGGKIDDTDFFNGTAVVGCNGQTQVVLID